MEDVFATYIRALGKGPGMYRSLTREEARKAMAMVLAGEASPLQVAAFLMLLRRNGETSEELAGMVEALRARLPRVRGLAIDLDWPSYAEPHNQQPWFVLAALALAGAGYRVLMHGNPGAPGDAASTRDVLAALDLELAYNLNDAKASINSTGFAYLALESTLPEFHRLFTYRCQLGVRTCVNTLARALNPGAAPAQVIGVAHPAYRQLHQDVSHLMAQPRAAIIKGGGGEFQRNPLKPCEVAEVDGGLRRSTTWQPDSSLAAFDWRGETMDAGRVAALWRGRESAPAAEAAITATMATALSVLGQGADHDVAESEASRIWQDRGGRQETGGKARSAYLSALRAFKRYMPELLPTYEALIDLAGGGDLAARFLSFYNPPPYLSGCSQAIWPGREPLLVRNYDYAPQLSDGIILETKWNGQWVLGMADGLFGMVDGFNEAGLAVSLTFGGRQVVGDGFGVPIIIRYILEFCETAKDATEVLQRIPCHMAYNVTVVDAKRRHLTAYLSPDRGTVITDSPVATNHQERVEWHHHARATATVERERFLLHRLQLHDEPPEKFIAAFLRPPLYSTAFDRGFGTLYTAIYRPRQGEAEFRWPGEVWRFKIGELQESSRAVRYPL